MLFVGREHELSELDSAYSAGGSAFLIYGRRRVGKTTMLEKFCEGKRSIFLRCLKGGETINLSYFSDILSEISGTSCKFKTYIDFITELERLCSEEKTVVVIDEYSYIASPVISSLLQHFIDSFLIKSDSMLILCGSSVSIMKGEAADYTKPLYGRFKRVMVLKPLTLEEVRYFHPNMSDVDLLKLYLVIGGIPKYHLEFKQDTFDGCIRENYLRNDWMMDEAERLIESEIQNSSRALAILLAIGKGSTSLREISQKIGVDDNLVSKCIKLLEELGIVSKLNPMFDAPKRAVYYISDALFAFHFSLMPKIVAYFDENHVDESYRLIEPYINTFLGKQFESFCSDSIRKWYLTLDMGTWWMDKDDVHSEIDIVAKVSVNNVRFDLFCECKFRKSMLSMRDYILLRDRAERFSKVSNPRYLLFSISGFDDDLLDLNDPSVRLIGPEVLFGHSDCPVL